LAQDIQTPVGRLYFKDGEQAATKDIYICEVEQTADGYNYKVVKTYNNVGTDGSIGQ